MVGKVVPMVQRACNIYSGVSYKGGVCQLLFFLVRIDLATSLVAQLPINGSTYLVFSK